MKYLLPVLCLWVLISCNKVSGDTSTLEGTYIGYFHHNRHDTTRVLFNFSENAFQGKSTNTIYSGTSKGAFELKDNIISFTNAAIEQADFNTPSVIKGTYNYQRSTDGTIRIWRQNKTLLDEYILRRHIQ